MSYGHAAELAQEISPREKLVFLIRELGRWAALNPSIRALHEEFVAVDGELKG